MANNVLLDVQIGQLPIRTGATSKQLYAEDIASRLIIRFPSDGSTFGIGSVLPTSDEGPFFKSETPDQINGIGQASSFELYVWSDSVGEYRLANLQQTQLRYLVSSTQPTVEENGKYLLWFKVDTQGSLDNVYTFNRGTNAWESALARLDYVNNLFSNVTEVAGVNKGQIDWDNVLNRPKNIITAGETGDSGSALTPAVDYQRLWHTGINAEIIYVPSFGGWQVAGGATGDLKFVTSLSLGTTGDFNAGTFLTALGRNPGWVAATDEEGRVLVAAAPTEDWNSLTADKKIAGSTFGTGAHTLTGAESGIAEHNHEVFARSDAGSSDQIEGFGGVTNIAVAGETDGTKTTIRVNGNNQDIIVKEGNTSATSAHNNVQPSIARFLLRKV